MATTAAPAIDYLNDADPSLGPVKAPLPSIDAASIRLIRNLLPSTATIADIPTPPASSSTSTDSTPSNSTLQLLSSLTLASSAGKTVRRWMSSSYVNKCRGMSYANIKEAAGRLVGGEIEAVIRKFGEGIVEVGEVEDASSCPATPPHPLVLPTLSAWLLSLAINSLLTSHASPSQAFSLSTTALTLIPLDSTPVLSPLLAKIYRYRSIAASTLGGDTLKSFTSEVNLTYRASCLAKSVDVQATLLNIMLGSLLANNLIVQARMLTSNATFPDTASNNQVCRNLYYMGRLQALQLEYTDSYSKLSQCLRKSPTNTGLGFRVTVIRLSVCVQLLTGEIPKREIFFEHGLRLHLAPYLQITQAVRNGDLKAFGDVVDRHILTFKKEGTYTLINRLSHNVVKAGLRKLNISYSKISLVDVAARLSLGSVQSAEFIVAKAIRDGVIDAVIDHDGGFVMSNDITDVYSTAEPSIAFHRRITFCLNTHNEAVKGLRYPEDKYKLLMEREKGDEKTDEEIAMEIEEEMNEDDEM